MRPSSRSSGWPPTSRGRSATTTSATHHPGTTQLGTWTTYGNEYWPAKYLIDARGRVRYVHFGEGDYRDTTERAIRSLLAEAGRPATWSPGVPAPTPPGPIPASPPQRPTSAPPAPSASSTDPFVAGCQEHRSTVRWRWRCRPTTSPTGAARGVRGESATVRSQGASLDLNFGARRVFLVLGSPGGKRALRVSPGRKAGPGHAWRAVTFVAASPTISGQRLHRLVDLPKAGRHDLRLRIRARDLRLRVHVRLVRSPAG